MLENGSYMELGRGGGAVGREEGDICVVVWYLILL
jgi:hypothetical protein